MELWMVGRWSDGSDLEFLGVASSEEIARSWATERNDWIAPIMLDVRAQDEPITWPGIYYPNLGQRPDGE